MHEYALKRATEARKEVDCLKEDVLELNELLAELENLSVKQSYGFEQDKKAAEGEERLIRLGKNSIFLNFFPIRALNLDRRLLHSARSTCCRAGCTATPESHTPFRPSSWHLEIHKRLSPDRLFTESGHRNLSPLVFSTLPLCAHRPQVPSPSFISSAVQKSNQYTNIFSYAVLCTSILDDL
jgi:hypothetical protein